MSAFNVWFSMTQVFRGGLRMYSGCDVTFNYASCVFNPHSSTYTKVVYWMRPRKIRLHYTGCTSVYIKCSETVSKFSSSTLVNDVECFVDVESINDVEDQDRLTVVWAPSQEVNISCVFAILFALRYWKGGIYKTHKNDLQRDECMSAGTVSILHWIFLRLICMCWIRGDSTGSKGPLIRITCAIALFLPLYPAFFVAVGLVNKEQCINALYPWGTPEVG